MLCNFKIIFVISFESNLKMFVSSRCCNFFNRAFKVHRRLYITVTSKNKYVQAANLNLPKVVSFSDEKKLDEASKLPLSSFLAKSEEETQRSREASWRTMKYTFIIFGGSMSALALYILFELGKAPTDEYGHPVMDEYTHMPTIKQYLYRTISKLDYYNKLIKEPSREKLLPDPVKYPYYQPTYTLVLELTDVLVHPDWTYKTGWRFKKRPGIDTFLESLSGLYEIVIFTAEQGMTVFPIIEALDPKNLISYKLVRDATHFVEGHHVKNLDKLNRDLSKVIVVDWNPQSVKFHPENIFHIQRWMGNNEDTTLLDLTAFLETVAHSEVSDVREVLRYYSEFDDPLTTFRIKQRELAELQDAKAKVQDVDSPLKRLGRGLFGKSF